MEANKEHGLASVDIYIPYGTEGETTSNDATFYSFFTSAHGGVPFHYSRPDISVECSLTISILLHDPELEASVGSENLKSQSNKIR